MWVGGKTVKELVTVITSTRRVKLIKKNLVGMKSTKKVVMKGLETLKKMIRNILILKLKKFFKKVCSDK